MKNELENNLANFDSESFCFYPFMQMLMQPNGDISPCCWNQATVWGNAEREELLKIWNSEKAQDFRREFLNSNPISCQKQIREIGCNKLSLRQFQKEIDLKAVQTKSPLRLDVRLNGKCNLQCIMCDVWQQPNGTYERSDFWTKGPLDLFPFLKEIDVLGGEPFVQKDTFRLIDQVAQVNQSAAWSFVTNGQYEFNDSITSRLDKINIRWIQVSLDSLSETTYKKIRKGGELKKTLRTIEKLVRYQKLRAAAGSPFVFNISFCIQQENWMETPQFIDFCNDNGVGIIIQFAYEPAEVSLNHLDTDSLRSVLNFFSALPSADLQILSAVIEPMTHELRGRNLSRNELEIG